MEQSKKTPRIVLEKGRILIIGRSISENPGELYRPVHEWVISYLNDLPEMTEIRLGFEFINTTSIKWIYAILKELGRMPDMPAKARVTWYYEEGDEDMCDLGFILRSLVDCPFHIMEVDDFAKFKFPE
ncbi:MAG: SiaC family regulatory phosphoprotein [Bacteroidales bacterium]